MKVYRGIQDERLRSAPRSIAIGIFDGVHRGHRLIIQRALEAAKKKKLRCMVVTFDPHPRKVLSGRHRAPKVLMSLEHRLRIFSSIGAQEALVIHFDKKFSRLDHEVFLEQWLLKKLGMRALSVGRDFCFGRMARGDHQYLAEASKRLGFTLQLTAQLKDSGKPVSSTRIRQLIEKGDLVAAQRLLGRVVGVYGTVVRGRGRGRSIGFPTANLDPHHETLPPAGVYAAWGLFGRKVLRSVVHIGVRPTFKDDEKSVEVHFPGFSGDLYGKELELLFLGRLRGIRRFPSAKALAAQIDRDILKADQLFQDAR